MRSLTKIYNSKFNLLEATIFLLLVIMLAIVISIGSSQIGVDILTTWILLIFLLYLVIIFADKKDVLSAQNLMPFLGLLIAVRTFSIVISEPVSWYGTEYFPVDEPLVVINNGLLITIVSLIIFFFAFHMPLGQAYFAKSFPRFMLPIKRAKLTWLLLLIFLIGIVFQWLVIQRLGGVQALISDIGIPKDTTGMGILLLLGNLSMNAILIAYFRGKSKKSYYLKVSIGILLAGYLFMMGRRGNVLPLIVFALFAYYYRYKKIKLRTWILLGVSGYVLLAAMVLFRLYIQYEGFRTLILDNPLAFYFGRLHGDLSLVDAMFSVFANEEAVGMRFWSFNHWIGIFPYLVPRFLFPNKPVYLPLPRLINSNYINPFNVNGVPANMLGTFYLNAGLVGILVGIFVFAYISKTLVCYRRSRNESGIALFIYSLGMYLLLQFMRTGDFTAVLTQVLTQNGSLIFILLLAVGWRVLLDLKMIKDSSFFTRG
jgi:oligosaccharide repeat unit polymerase